MKVREPSSVPIVEYYFKCDQHQPEDYVDIQEMFQAVEVVGIIAVCEPSSVDERLSCLAE